jgi:prevent-host-death family protein
MRLDKPLAPRLAFCRKILEQNFGAFEFRPWIRGPKVILLYHMSATHIKPVTEIKRHATEIIAQLEADRVPVLITEHGRAAAVMLDVESYQAMTRKLDLLEGIARGERAFSEGRIVSHEEAKTRLGRWLDESR